MATIMQHSNHRAWPTSKCRTLSQNGSSKMLKSNIMAAKKLSGIEFLRENGIFGSVGVQKSRLREMAMLSLKINENHGVLVKNGPFSS